MAFHEHTPTPGHQMHKFIRITKVDEVRHEVWGVATEEVEDLSGEIMDYDSSKPLFEAWSAHASEVTGGKSLGNIREMHTSIAAGKVIAMNCDDGLKRISIGTKIVDPNSWDKVLEGVLTGFSIGGTYANTWKDGKLTRYTARPSEISVVDLPCLSTAVFEFIKADGTSEMRKFKQGSTDDMAANVLDYEVLATKVVAQMAKNAQKTKSVAGEKLTFDAFAVVGDVEKTETWHMPIKLADEAMTKHFIRKALAWLPDSKHITDTNREAVTKAVGDAATAVGIKFGEERDAAIKKDFHERVDKAAESSGLKKGLYEVQEFASLLQSLFYIYRRSVYEADVEQDDSPIPSELYEHLDSLAETFLSMAEEEVNELTASAAEGVMLMSAQNTDLLKAAKGNLANHFKKSAAHHKKMAAIHKAFGSSHGEVSKCFGKAEDTDHDKAVHKFHKEAGAGHEKAEAEHLKMAEHCEKMHASCGEGEDAEKAVTAVADSLTKADEPDADVIAKNAPAVVPGDAAEAVQAQLQDVFKGMMDNAIKAVQASPEMQKAFADKAAEQMQVALGTAVKSNGTHGVLQPRPGQETVVEKSASSTAQRMPDISDTGL
jgi:hypothetical protein